MDQAIRDNSLKEEETDLAFGKLLMTKRETNMKDNM
jgi:hypothetical protein